MKDVINKNEEVRIIICGFFFKFWSPLVVTFTMCTDALADEYL